MTDGAAAFTLPNRDFDVRSFRSNAVLRWEWRPGSTLFVVWQQNRAREVPEWRRLGPGDLFGSLARPRGQLPGAEGDVLAAGAVTVKG